MLQWQVIIKHGLTNNFNVYNDKCFQLRKSELMIALVRAIIILALRGINPDVYRHRDVERI